MTGQGCAEGFGITVAGRRVKISWTRIEWKRARTQFSQAGKRQKGNQMEMETVVDVNGMETVQRLSKDLRRAATEMYDREARCLVKSYYIMQEQRVRVGNQISSGGDTPNEVLKYFFEQSGILEKQMHGALTAYAKSHDMGVWAMGICGIGPIISAGLLAHINLEPWVCAPHHGTKKVCWPGKPCTPECKFQRLTTAGHIWSFAGLDPRAEWKKGKRRPWNAALKTLCWKIGESFVKVSGRDNDIYGKLYLQRKAEEIERNERLEFADQAKEKLEKFDIGESTDAYKAYSIGKLPPGHIHARAKRWAVKIFLSHWFERAYELKWGEKPPMPYAQAILGHAHKIEPPE